MGLKVKLRVELIDSTMIPLTEIQLPNIHKTFDEYGIHDHTEPGYDTPVHAAAEYLNQYLDIKTGDMDTLLGIENNNINRIAGIYANGSGNREANYFWMYMINDTYPTHEGSRLGYTMATYPLKDGDIITMFAVRYPFTNFYGFFKNHHFTVKSGEIINLTLLGIRVTGGKSIPLSQTELTASYGQSKLDIQDKIITDHRGEVAISFIKTGSYIVNAVRDDISRAYVNISVTG